MEEVERSEVFSLEKSEEGNKEERRELSKDFALCSRTSIVTDPHQGTTTHLTRHGERFGQKQHGNNNKESSREEEED